MALPYVIKILVASGDPDGVRVVEKTNWTGLGVMFPRGDLGEAKKPGLDRPGVYLLMGDDQEGDGDQALYIGQGENVGDRLSYHQGDDSKEFWTDTVAFVSASRSLNRAHITYLESKLISLAHAAKRARMVNRAKPSVPSLTPADTAEADGFLAELLGILPALGIDLFTIAEQVQEAEIRYQLEQRGAKGTGVERSDGFLVLAGSLARIEPTESFDMGARRLRKRLVESGQIEERDGSYVFLEDVLFRSPSAAAGALVAASINGRAEWRDSSGTSLKENQIARAEGGS